MKKRYLLILIGVISFAVGFSYAYFTPVIIGNDTANEHYVTLGNLRLTYNTTDYLDFDGALPGDINTGSFTVKNTGTASISGYDIYLSQLINTFENDELVISLSCTSSDANPCSGIIDEPVPYYEEENSIKIITASSINSNVTHTYTLSLKFIDTGLEQNYNLDAFVEFKVTINEILYGGRGVMRASSGINDTYAFWGMRDQIKEIKTGCVNYFSGKMCNVERLQDVTLDDADEVWDVSADLDESVTAFIVYRNFDGYYDLYITGDYDENGDYLGFNFNPNSSYLFADFSSLYRFEMEEHYINGNEYIPTTGAKNISYMFSNCQELYDVGYLALVGVENINSIFEKCYSLNIAHLDFMDFNITEYNNIFADLSSNVDFKVHCCRCTYCSFECDYDLYDFFVNMTQELNLDIEVECLMRAV